MKRKENAHHFCFVFYFDGSGNYAEVVWGGSDTFKKKKKSLAHCCSYSRSTIEALRNFDYTKIDLDLVMALIHHIVATKEVGMQLCVCAV